MLTICVENDQLFPDHVRTEGQKILKENHVEHEIHVYPGVPHGIWSNVIIMNSLVLTASVGFAVVGEYEDPKIKEAQSSAFEQMVQWLKSH